MPTIYLDGPPVSDLDRKRQVVKEITEAASRYYKIPEEAMVVIIKENPPENVGLAGRLLADRQRPDTA
jgi:4-oxalocrotonate tautomerase